jgi:carbon storage regulator
MLVLSRKKNESIIINDDITIVVVEIRGDKVRLGVEAPKEVPVHRREVYDAIRRNESGGTSSTGGKTSGEAAPTADSARTGDSARTAEAAPTGDSARTAGDV